MAEYKRNPIFEVAPYAAIIGAIWSFSQTYGGKIEKIDGIDHRVEKLEAATPEQIAATTHLAVVSQRLDRIENKLDRLAENTP